MRNRIFRTSLLFVFLLSTVLLTPALAQQKEDWPGKTFTVTKEVWRTPAKSQGRTGTCWCFSTTSFLESEAHRLGRGDFNLSEIYTVYYAYLEKPARYIRMHGNQTLGQGGLSHDVIYFVRKYGLVRKEDYDGLIYSKDGHNHSEMSRAVFSMIKGLVDERRSGPSPKWPNAVQGILNAYIGKVPSKIEYEGKELTPKQFADEVLQIPYDDYLEFTSYSYMPFWKQGELLIPDNWMHFDGFYNVPLDDFVRIIDHALENGYSLVFDLDTAEKTYNSRKGIAFTPEDKEGAVIDQELRDAMFDDWRTIDTHLEHAVGLADDEKGKRWFLVKNSGGEDRGPYKGHEYFSENFVRGKVPFIMVHKDGLPGDIKEKLGIK